MEPFQRRRCTQESQHLSFQIWIPSFQIRLYHQLVYIMRWCWRREHYIQVVTSLSRGKVVTPLVPMSKFRHLEFASLSCYWVLVSMVTRWGMVWRHCCVTVAGFGWLGELIYAWRWKRWSGNDVCTEREFACMSLSNKFQIHSVFLESVSSARCPYDHY